MQKLDLVRLYSEKRALVVDEFPDMRASIRRMLRSFGVEIVDLANDGSEAMMRCRENEYDIIICDYSLGSGKNGQQILEELRHTQSFKHQAIYILITAETTRSMVFGALEYKPDDYLTKPFTQVLLQSRLDNIVLEKQFFSSVYKALDNSDYLAAASNAEVLVGRQSEYRTAAQKLQGHALLLAKEYDRAHSLYQAVMEVRRQEWACIGCARALIGLQKWSSAIHVLSELIDHGTENLEVFDALAEAELALGRNGVAQAILERATVSSPYGILRQINLAEVALANNDYLAAEKAYRRVIKLGLNSCHDSHEHSLGLVRCLLDKEKQQLSGNSDTFKECYTVCHRVKKKYSNVSQVTLQANLIEAKALAQQGEVKLAMEHAQKLFDKYRNEDNILPGLGLDMAAALLAIERPQQGREVLKDLADRFAEDALLLSKIDAMADQPISAKAKENAGKINAEGKGLFEAGKFDEAVEHFQGAVSCYPNNVELKLNLLLAMMQSLNANSNPSAAVQMLDEASSLIASLESLPSVHKAYHRYQSLASEISQMQNVA
ncbi:MAG: response regulator [Pseudomonadales bacterium]|nr:response regulator [Pseudomonadales bacterium]